jgi:dihydroorotate dehydrogenase
MNLYKTIAKPLLFFLSPEQAHHLSLSLFRIALQVPVLGSLLRQAFRSNDPKLKKEVMGLSFPNPVGLAAGFDKDGRHYKTMAALGFGFVEIGTVTPRPQAGNPRPRLFRLPKDEALINRMGFNNEGVDAMVERLKNRPDNLIIGGNIGKNKDTPNEKAHEDYFICFEKLFPYVDYFVVNVSSPNTPNLRELQNKEPLLYLLNTLQNKNREKKEPKPILLKIAPDLSDEQLDDILDIVQESGIAGLIATNTTIDRKGLNTSGEQVTAIGNGGLSGAPLKQRSTEVIRYLKERKPELLIIGVGGIASGDDALEKIEAGATLLQVYSGLIYEGPGLIRKLNRTLQKSL